MILKRPFLACSRNVLPEDLQSLQYPLYGTPKLDGIRMLIIKQGKKSVAVSRKLLPIPNAIIQQWVEECNLPEGLDGEIIIPGKTFHEIQSKVMSSYTITFPFRYCVFDRWNREETYLLRSKSPLTEFENVYWLHSRRLNSPDAVEVFETACLAGGYEGIILRSGDGPYKQGRSTWKEGYMLKMKRFEDCEGIIISVEEKMHNDNPKQTDETGYTKRSKHKANMRGAGTMGKMLVKDCKSGQIVTLGGGWDADFALKIWNQPNFYKGETVTYKKQSHGEKDAPRIATFKGIRYD